MFFCFLLFAAEVWQLKDGVSLSFNKNKNQYSISRGQKTTQQYSVSSNLDAFYWQCLEHLHNLKFPEFSKEISEKWISSDKKTPYYHAAWLYRGKYVPGKEVNFQDYWQQRPEEPKDSVLLYEYNLRLGIVALRLNNCQKSQTYLKKILDYKTIENSSQQMIQKGKHDALFYLLQISSHLKQYSDCFLYLQQIDRNIAGGKEIFQELCGRVKDACVKDWYERILLVREIIAKQGCEQQKLLEEGKFWNQNAPSSTVSIGLGVLYFSDGCYGNTDLKRRTSLSVAERYLQKICSPASTDQSEETQTAWMYYIRTLKLLRKPYQPYLMKLDPEHQNELDDILTGSVLYVTRVPILQLGETAMAQDFLEKGWPEQGCSTTIPFNTVEKLKHKLRPGDFEYFQAERAFDNHNFQEALHLFQIAQIKGSGIVDPIDITICLIMLGQVNPVIQQAATQGVNAVVLDDVCGATDTEPSESEESDKSDNETAQPLPEVRWEAQAQPQQEQKEVEISLAEQIPSFSTGQTIEERLQRILRNKDRYGSRLVEIARKSRADRHQQPAVAVEVVAPDITNLTTSLSWKDFNQAIMNHGWQCFKSTGQGKHLWVYEVRNQHNLVKVIRIDAPHPGEKDAQRISAQGHVLQAIKEHLGLR